MITVTPEVETLLREDDYVNKETGLIFCKNCRTPRQIRLYMAKMKSLFQEVTV